MKRQLDAIIVGERARRDFGDIDALAGSMTRIGLLHPIVINGDGELIAGARRLEAARRLGWADVDVTVATSLDGAVAELQAERDENECRKDMTPEEAVNLGERLRALEEEDADRRKAEGHVKGGETAGRGRPIARGSTDPQAKDRVRDRLGAAVGMSGRSYERARRVVETAADPSQPPEVREAAEAAVALMNETGSVRAADDKVRKAKMNAATRTKAQPTDKRRERARKRRAYSSMGRFANTAQHAANLAGEIDMVAVLDLASAADRDEWTRSLTAGIRALTQMRRALSEGIAE